jgi:dTDP-4-amino-4,6-dideoxygalactose transaminase
MAIHDREEWDYIREQCEGKPTSGYRGSHGDWFYGGPQVKLLEREWEQRFGVKHAICCNSATSGLWLACAAAGVELLDRVGVVPYSMTCSASVPLHFRAIPHFIDIEPDYFCMSPDDLERWLKSEDTRCVKAIIVVDLFGQPYDADRINAIAKRHGIKVIEDAAQACGATYNGRYAGTLGDIGVYSFNVHKVIECGEGGMVVTNDDELAERVRMLLNHAEAVNNDRQEERFNDLVGMNMRIGTEMQAASIRFQLAHRLDDRLKYLRDCARNFPVKIRPSCESAFYRYAWTAEDVTDEKIRFLDGAQFDGSQYTIKRHYIKPIFRMPLFKSLGYEQDQCPVCRATDEEIILAWPKEMEL